VLIAIVGVTPRMQYGGRFLAAALKAKDRIRVYAVNPRYDEIMGVKSYPSVTNLPEAPMWWASSCPAGADTQAREVISQRD
jgi:predicted CoA-binding protein